MSTGKTVFDLHHDLALQLLVGRSLPKGVPWTLLDDQRLIAEERVLWNMLDPTAQALAQTELTALWGHRGATREVLVNPAWGEWTKGLGPMVLIPDSSFGGPAQSFRPVMKGVLVLKQEYPQKGAFLQWLWDRGFHPFEIEAEVLILAIPSHRVLQEADRLANMLARDWPKEQRLLTVQGFYDPQCGRATLTLSKLSDFPSGS